MVDSFFLQICFKDIYNVFKTFVCIFLDIFKCKLKKLFFCSFNYFFGHYFRSN